MQFFFFNGWIHILSDYIIYKVTINRFFALNLKIGRILRSTIRFYDLWSYLSPTILRRIPILTTLNIYIISLWIVHNCKTHVLHAKKIIHEIMRFMIYIYRERERENILLLDESQVTMLGKNTLPKKKQKIVLWVQTAHQLTFSCFLMTLMPG